MSNCFLTENNCLTRIEASYQNSKRALIILSSLFAPGYVLYTYLSTSLYSASFALYVSIIGSRALEYLERLRDARLRDDLARLRDDLERLRDGMNVYV
jgi:hypothetical protein